MGSQAGGLSAPRAARATTNVSPSPRKKPGPPGQPGSPDSVIGIVRDVTERKDLERKLRDSEERYRTLVEMAREGIYLLDAEARLVFGNQCLADMLGYRLDEILGRSVFEFMDEETRKPIAWNTSATGLPAFSTMTVSFPK